MPLPFFVALIQTGFQVPLPLDLHGGVDHGADQFRQVIHPICGNLFHDFFRQCKIILVGHVVIPLWCENRKDNLTYHLLLRSWNLQKQSYTTT